MLSFTYKDVADRLLEGASFLFGFCTVVDAAYLVDATDLYLYRLIRLFYFGTRVSTVRDAPRVSMSPDY